MSFSRSVHNVRIERLWVDVTAQVGAVWADLFTHLELNFGLDINHPGHIWLLHILFLPLINAQLAFFADAWNQHQLQIRGGPNRSPADLFGFDMFVHGVRGDQLPPEDAVAEEELEVFGVDWEGLHDDQLLASLRANNPVNEQATSWLGRTGPPENLSEVSVDPPQLNLTLEHMQALETLLHRQLPIPQSVNSQEINSRWVNGLAIVRSIYGDLF